jgi:hypothetical protein
MTNTFKFSGAVALFLAVLAGSPALACRSSVATDVRGHDNELEAEAKALGIEMGASVPREFPESRRRGAVEQLHSLRCKIACNNDPLKGCFRVQ